MPTIGGMDSGLHEAHDCVHIYLGGEHAAPDAAGVAGFKRHEGEQGVEAHQQDCGEQGEDDRADDQHTDALLEGR